MESLGRIVYQLVSISKTPAWPTVAWLITEFLDLYKKEAGTVLILIPKDEREERQG